MRKDYLQELVRILARLRAPGGCPWDRKQTHRSLMYYLVEESGELLDAIENESDDDMCDELGDVLLQVILHAQIASEDGRFDIQDVARSECEKMIRRHPHVFADADVEDSQGVVDQWEQIKRAERKGAERRSAVSGVPRHVPALHRAGKIQSRAAKVGFEWPSAAAAMAKVEEELAELKTALESGDQAAVEEELGDLLFAAVNVGRMSACHAEEALHATVRKFDRRFRFVEEHLRNQGRAVSDCGLDELEALWVEAKCSERS